MSDANCYLWWGIHSQRPFYCGIGIDNAKALGKKRIFLCVSLFGNLLILCFFKYYNFFAENLQDLLGLIGIPCSTLTLNIVLPIGISFYTFQTMSYSIDIYRGILRPTRQFLDFAHFVAFFPQLVAGPIERAKTLLPQVTAPRTISLPNQVTAVE